MLIQRTSSPASGFLCSKCSPALMLWVSFGLHDTNKLAKNEMKHGK